MAGIDLMLACCGKRDARADTGVFCLGATAEVLGGALARIAAEYPGVVIAGSRHGYFSAAEEDAVAAAHPTPRGPTSCSWP